jgi:hypothetical protein
LNDKRDRDVYDIDEYVFVDCLLVDFSIDRTAHSVDITVEAYYPTLNTNGQRKKGRIRIFAKEIKYLKMKMHEQFYVDLLREYSPDGHDFKSNEVYSVQITSENEDTLLILDSDFLQLELKSHLLSIAELD